MNSRWNKSAGVDAMGSYWPIESARLAGCFLIV